MKICMAGEDKYYIFQTGIYKVGRKGTVIYGSFLLLFKTAGLCRNSCWLFDV